MSQPNYMIRVEKGPDAGLVAAVPPGGASLGRSSKNDLVFRDETLSRHHCRIWFDGGIPVVSDLATVNGTLVNGTPVSGDTRLSPGDAISIGGTVLRLSGPDGNFGDPTVPPQPAPAAAPPAAAGAPEKRSRLVADLLVVALSLALAAVAVALFLVRPPAPPPLATQHVPSGDALQFDFLVLSGDSTNVVRRETVLEADGRLTVELDDLALGRRERKTSPAPVTPVRRDELAAAFRRADLFSMEPREEGPRPGGAWRSARVSALVDGRAATVELRNAPEPPAFRELREAVDAFARAELGL